MVYSNGYLYIANFAGYVVAYNIQTKNIDYSVDIVPGANGLCQVSYHFCHIFTYIVTLYC